MNRNKRNMITTALMVAMFLAAVEVTIVNAAMPTVVAALGGISLYSWVFSAFMLANTTTVPIYGKLADLYGRKRVFIVAVLLFITGSALCGLAQSMTQLVWFRALQGLGAGGVLPVAMTIIGDIFPFEARARVQGWFSSVWGFAAVIGPFIGGWTVEHFSWRWLFWFNLPIGLLVISIIAVCLPNRKEGERPHVDVVGAGLMTVSVFGLLYATLLIGEKGWQNPWPWGCLTVSAGLLTVFIKWERRVKDPFIPIRLLQNRIIASSNLTAFLTGMGMFGAISFVPLFVQGVLDKSPTLAGLAITPQVLGWTLGSIVAGHWILKSGYRPVILTGVSLIVAAALTFVGMGQDTAYGWVLVTMCVLGLGLGLSMTTYILAIQNAVPTRDRGTATSSQMFSRSMGGAFGVTILGAVMTFQLKRIMEATIQAHQGEWSPEAIDKLRHMQGIVSPESLAQLPAWLSDEMGQWLAHSLHAVFLTATVFSLLALLAAAVWIPKGSAQSMSFPEETAP
ncbi:MFS transporter [Polycladomyces sp. WAk]|uniref:MFS transporter n=1 Tax=Polycladomyces zharkentensis TaxID=2807616 RepID=A0ABS2WH63_9BACL|nr:MDR family MFS transporter [Polycladomyces sp. WAk]MBN2908759.1 MFS transporter [Polycladomyces sp. WAk]